MESLSSGQDQVLGVEGGYHASALRYGRCQDVMTAPEESVAQLRNSVHWNWIPQPNIRAALGPNCALSTTLRSVREVVRISADLQKACGEGKV